MTFRITHPPQGPYTCKVCPPASNNKAFILIKMQMETQEEGGWLFALPGNEPQPLMLPQTNLPLIFSPVPDTSKAISVTH